MLAILQLLLAAKGPQQQQAAQAPARRALGQIAGGVALGCTGRCRTSCGLQSGAWIDSWVGLRQRLAGICAALRQTCGVVRRRPAPGGLTL